MGNTITAGRIAIGLAVVSLLLTTSASAGRSKREQHARSNTRLVYGDLSGLILCGKNETEFAELGNDKNRGRIKTTLPLGARLRVTVQDPKLTPYIRETIKWASVTRLPDQTFVFQGELRSLREETMVLKDENVFTPLRLPYASVKKIELSRGRSLGINTRQGVRYGLYIGTIGTTFFFFVRSVTWGGVKFNWGEYVLFLLAGGVTGTAVGAAVGALIPGDKWERVPLPWEAGVLPDEEVRLRLAGSFPF